MDKNKTDDYLTVGDLDENVIFRIASKIDDNIELFEEMSKTTPIPKDSNFHESDIIDVSRQVSNKRVRQLEQHSSILQLESFKEGRLTNVDYVTFKYLVGMDLADTYLTDIYYEEKSDNVSYTAREKLKEKKKLGDIKRLKMGKSYKEKIKRGKLITKYPVKYLSPIFSKGNVIGSHEEINLVLEREFDKNHIKSLRRKSINPLIDIFRSKILRRKNENDDEFKTRKNKKTKSGIKEYASVFRPDYYNVTLIPGSNYDINLLFKYEYKNIGTMYFIMSYLLDSAYQHIYKSNIDLDDLNIDKNKGLSFIDTMSFLGFSVITSEQYLGICNARNEECPNIDSYTIYTGNTGTKFTNNAKYTRNNIDIYPGNSEWKLDIIDDEFRGIPFYMNNSVLFMRFPDNRPGLLKPNGDIIEVKSYVVKRVHIKSNWEIKGFVEWVYIKYNDREEIYSNLDPNLFDKDGFDES